MRNSSFLKTESITISENYRKALFEWDWIRTFENLSLPLELRSSETTRPFQNTNWVKLLVQKQNINTRG